MKSKFTYLAFLAIIISACSTGGYVSSPYTDDIYFNPSDETPPIVAAAGTQSGQNSTNTIVVNEISQNEDGTNSTNSYIFEGNIVDANDLAYETGLEGEGMDTITYYEDGEMVQLIDNYIDDKGNVDYAYRINRFHNPYFYDPFYWDSWYYDPYCYTPGWSISFGWGWGYPGYGWGYPGYGWGYPGYGWGGYYPPYYPGYPGYYPPYYPGYPSYPIYPGNGEYAYGQRRSSGTNVDRNQRGSSAGMAQNTSGRVKSGNTQIQGDSNLGRSTTSSSGRRDDVSGSSGNRTATKSNIASSEVLTEKRRSGGEGNYSRQSQNVNSTATQAQVQSYTRPGTNTQSRTYTRPSTNSTRVSTQPRVVSSSTTSRYAQPKSSSSYNQTYRASSTYNRSSSSGVSSRTYRSSSTSSNYYRSSPSNSSSSSYKSGNYSSGSSSSRSSGSYSSGSSSRSSSGGSYSGGSSGGGRSSGGSSSSSGRR